MNPYIGNLVQKLEELAESHQSLLQAAGSMNAALKSGKVVAVQSITATYDELAGRIAELEEQRLAICDLLAADCTPPRNHISLTAAIDLADIESRQKLRELQGRLKSTIEALQRLNASNAIMLDEGLRTINKRFELVATEQKKFTGYQSKGAMEAPTVNRCIINRVA